MKLELLSGAVLMSVVAAAHTPVDTLHSYSLHEIVVSGTRWAQDKELQSHRITTVNFADANTYNPQTVADILGSTGDVFIQKSQYGGGSPMIRGFATNRLLYSIDGVRMNTAIFRSGNIQNVISLDPFAISSSEVMFGPGSVSYGSDAIGGAMTFSTLRPSLSVSTAPRIYGSATLRTATASSELTEHVHFGAGWKQWAFLTSFSHSSFGDLKQGVYGPDDYVRTQIVEPGFDADGMDDRVIANTNPRSQTPSGYSQFNLMQKVRFAPSKNWDIEYAFHWSETSDYARYDRHLRTKNGLPRYAEWNYGPQKWMMNNLKVENSERTLMYDSLRVSVAYQRFEESRISRDLNSPNRETQTESVDAWSINADFKRSPSRSVGISYGAEYVLNKVRSVGEGLNILSGETIQISSRYPKAHWHSAGVYAQADWRLSPALSLSAGVRYNYYRIDNDFSAVGYDVPFSSKQSSSSGSVSGNVGMNWSPGLGWLLRVNYARGFRAPNVDDMGKLFDSVDGCVTVPNPALKPEYADNVELGIAKSFGSHFHFDITGYYTHLTDAIVRRDFIFNGSTTMEYMGESCRVQALQNAAVARVWGIQGAFKTNFSKWFYAEANLNWQRGFEELDSGDISPSRHVAPLFGRAAVGFEHNKLKVELFTVFQAECAAKDMPEEEKDKTEIYALDENGNAYAPAWCTLNLQASYSLIKNLILSATVENIADRRYRPYSCGISAPGRNLTLSLTYSL
ncbi:MAG: TonB-dependent receptor [Bacteroidales bacterium]|nr:TonB-dependent receptor [Bacteroidales bacterium]